MAHIPTPRLLPLTIFALGGLLAMKSVTLVRAAAGGASDSPAAAAPAVPAPHTAATASQNYKAAGSPPTTQGVATTPGGTSAGVANGPPPGPSTSVSPAERAVLLELRQRRHELDAREAVVTTREATLAAAELRINARVGELQTLQKKLEDLEQARKQREDVSWTGLVKVYESMKPHDAATIFNDLDMNVLLGVVDRMKDRNAAPILAAMQPDKARELTTKLAALRTKRAAVAQSN